MEELKRFENELKNNEELREKLNTVIRRIVDEGKYGSDGEVMVAAAKELGFEITIASLEQARAEAEELDLEALKAVSGGQGNDSMPTDEKGHDGWCVAVWHCFTAMLHTDTDSPNVSCWSDFLCTWFSKGYDEWAERIKKLQNK